jgi:hypothetical protein
MSNPRIKNLLDLLKLEAWDSPHALGRSLYKYTDCGPWASFSLPGKADSIYYGDDKARKGWRKWARRCSGINIGSIVEGSDVNVGPTHLSFPFTKDEFWAAVKAINDEAAFYWKRDNSRNYALHHDGKRSGWMTCTEFEEPQWDDDVPAKVRKALLKWLENHCCQQYDKQTEFGLRGWTVSQWVDDSTF